MLKTISIFFLLLLNYTAFTQQDLGLHLMRHNLLSSQTNPAMVPREKLVIGLPNLGYNHFLTNIRWQDLFAKNDRDENVLTINTAIAKMQKDNILREKVELGTLALSYRLGKLTLGFNHAFKYNAYLNYPKTLPQLIWQGNAQFVGQNIDLSNDLQVFGYSEFGLSLAAQLSQKISIGARAKLLTGIGDVSTTKNDLSLFTDEDVYQLQLQGDYLVNSSSYFNFNGFNDFDFRFNFGQFQWEDVFSSNLGFAFDLGVYIQLEKLDIALSAIDIGQINWTENVQNYALTGTREYVGLDAAQAFIEGNITFGSAVDTLEQIFQINTTQNDYSTVLPARYYLSTSYQVNNNWRVGAVFHLENYREQLFPSIGVGANYRLNKSLEIGATYSMINEVYDNLGLNALLRLGPVQIFAAADNVIAAFNVIDNNANARLGVNLVFE